ncbi:hypothetical protein [Tautonia plasticadhaerens]|uniref:Glycosyltransferase RgtA/B/C/D-like domain-containing protein n=1 Tax=Tautonia plasticadhaerens TaxID=2527974 RepID=A0A518HDQ7_9BACT|nr:hypothetical protein [Tautonia plasticadhaerens]QDV38970.1 hypothetical protein ElP_69310 [Tautonia plasticadhaerens]
MRSSLLPVLLVAAAASPLYLASASKIVDHDVFVMGEVAQMVLDGGTLYESAWDNKAPLALLPYALPLGLAPGSYRAVQAGLLAIVTLQAILLWGMLRGEAAWFRVGAAALAILMPLHAPEFVWWSSEDVANLLVIPVVVGSYRIASRGELGRGACLGIGAGLVLGFHARQTVLLLGLVPLAALLGCGAPAARRLGAAAWMAAGAAVGLAAIAALITWVGDWGGYVETVFLAPRRYKGHPWNMIQGIYGAKDRLPAAMMVASTVVLAARGPGRPFYLALAAASAGVVLSPMKPFYHYYEQLTPALCLMVPAAIGRLCPPREAPVALGAVLAAVGLNGVLTCGHLGLVNTELPGTQALGPMDRVVEAIEGHAGEDDTLFAAGGASAYLYFATDIPSANPYFWDLFFTTNILGLAPVDPESVYRDYEADPPDLLVLDRRTMALARGESDPGGLVRYAAMLSGWLESGRFQEVEQVEGYTIFRLRGLPAANGPEAVRAER